VPAPSLTSLIDVVDEQNQPIGVVRRRDLFRLRANFRTVHVLIFNSHAELLLHRLTWTKDREPGRWGSSAAGYLHAAEGYQEAAQRRLAEELSLTVPLAEVGVTCLRDEAVAQFAGVFTATADSPRSPAHAHLAEIGFRPLAAIEQDMAAHPDDYTETLRHVLSFWRQAARPAAERGACDESLHAEPVSAT
jgi:16S rRNA (adenine1518-N6/adenine1519-N6)-dimethyltransferase